MYIVSTFIEFSCMLMIYYISFIGIEKKELEYILRSIVGAIIFSISFVLFDNMGIWRTVIGIIIVALVTSKRYNKSIIVNIVQVILSLLLISIIELIFMVGINILVGNKDLPEIIYIVLLVISMGSVLSILYKIMKEKQYNFDAFIAKYNNIIWSCFNVMIIFFFVKILVGNESIRVEYILEVGILFFSIIVVNIYYFIDLYKKDKNKKKSEIKESINPLIQELIDEMKASEHEYKNHLNILYCMIQVCKEDELRDRAKHYIGNVFENKNLLNNLSNIENTILKAVLLSKINQAEKNEINCNYKIESQLENLPLDDSELTVILSNLLNNAIEAASKSDKKRIEFSTDYKDEKHIIKISNSVNNFTREMIPDISKVRFSTKGKGRGYGLYNIKNILHKYKGKINISLDEDIFNILIEI